MKLGYAKRLAVLVGAAAILAIAPKAPASAEECLPAIKERGVLVSANGLMGLRPFAWKNEQTGQYEGFEAELMGELAKRLGIPKWDYAITDWTTMIPGLKAGRWDIILSGMTVTQERIQGGGINYSRPYFMLYDTVIVLNDSPYQTVADLKDQTVASTLGTMDSINAHKLKDDGKVAEVMDFNTFGEPFQALRNGQVAAVVLDQATFQAQAEEMKDVRVIGDPLPYIPNAEWADEEKDQPYILGGTGVGVRKECTDLLDALNKALADMDADGTRKAILEKYGAWDDNQAVMMK
jgi:ABC-type amino acid transport substrate-binding protein